MQPLQQVIKVDKGTSTRVFERVEILQGHSPVPGVWGEVIFRGLKTGWSVLSHRPQCGMQLHQTPGDREGE